ncbi:MAG TPA: hypothetical protein VM243_09225 [Phycisphaerae bacterium]|nr:hypothetical protein [Phycisphaerae bacterium]
MIYDDDEEQDWTPDLDEEQDSEADQLPCPSCGAMVYDDTDRCPHCGDWIMPLSASAGSRSGIWIVAALLAIIGLLVWAVS